MDNFNDRKKDEQRVMVISFTLGIIVTLVLVLLIFALYVLNNADTRRSRAEEFGQQITVSSTKEPPTAPLYDSSRFTQ